MARDAAVLLGSAGYDAVGSNSRRADLYGLVEPGLAESATLGVWNLSRFGRRVCACGNCLVFRYPTHANLASGATLRSGRDYTFQFRHSCLAVGQKRVARRCLSKVDCL
jgi:hypothetical protein